MFGECCALHMWHCICANCGYNKFMHRPSLGEDHLLDVARQKQHCLQLLAGCDNMAYLTQSV